MHGIIDQRKRLSLLQKLLQVVPSKSINFHIIYIIFKKIHEKNRITTFKSPQSMMP